MDFLCTLTIPEYVYKWCNGKRSKNSEYCTTHKCRIDDCIRKYNCDVHVCEEYECSKRDGLSYCTVHNCRHSNCNKKGSYEGYCGSHYNKYKENQVTS